MKLEQVRREWRRGLKAQQMKHDFHRVVERDEEGWLVGSVPALSGRHTQAQTVDELSERMQDAIGGYLDTRGDDIALTEFVGIQKSTIES